MPARRGTPERFLTTVVMTDMVGSTEHAAELGDHGWRELLEVHHALVRAALRRAGGREIDTAGDGFFVTFDAPAAAVAFALEIERSVAELGLATRAGVHVGEVEQMGAKVTGLTVVIAARIMAAASAGEVLVSSTVRDLTTGSSLTFEDRGVRELKGVPGDWHVYAVARAGTELVDTGGQATATERRAAAVRRAQARPIWRRRPRLVAGVALGLAVVLASGGLLLAKPWQPAALASVSEDSIGIIDPARGEVIGEIPVGIRPGGIAVGGGSAWVTNTGGDSVTQIDLAKRSMVVRIDVGRSPKGIAVTDGSVWVANSGERTVSRINMATGRVVQTIEVGNGPTAIVAAGDGLWVANATDSTIVRLDAATGSVGEPIGVAAKPVALAADADGLWVASGDGASVSHHDPLTGATLAAPILLNARPTALAIDTTSVWVASSDGKVTRIDRGGNGVTATIPVGGSLATIAVSDDSIWVGDIDGTVYRLEAADPSEEPKMISTSSAVAALGVVDGGIWLAAQASTGSHRGGTLRIVAQKPADDSRRYDTDPLGSPFDNVAHLTGDGLLGYRRTGGSAGSALLPNLATSAPVIGDGGRSYTFRLRPGLEYSTGVPVRAADFRRALERSFQMGSGFLYGSIVGAKECTTENGTPIEVCDLSRGVVTDDAAGTITFHLVDTDPDFAYKLAHPAAHPVPEGVPMNALLDNEAFPGTGPYTLTGRTEDEVRLARNARFRAWDTAVRPDGFPDEIVFTFVEGDGRSIEMVENNEADYTRLFGTSPDLRARIRTQHPDRMFSGASTTNWIELNTSIPPFDNIDARKAVNFAIDRARMAELRGPGTGATCQILPPGFPGYRPYCPYTARIDAGGRWTAPDMQAAQRHIDASGTRGQRVTLGPVVGGTNPRFEYVGQVLEDLGYDVTLDTRNTLEFPAGATPWDVTRTQAMLNGWVPDYVAPAAFLGNLRCAGAFLNNYCDPEFNRRFDHALQLQTTDPAAALAEWADLDRRAVDLALLTPVDNTGAVFVSEQVGNYQYNPAYEGLFDQMWVQ